MFLCKDITYNFTEAISWLYSKITFGLKKKELKINTHR